MQYLVLRGNTYDDILNDDNEFNELRRMKEVELYGGTIHGIRYTMLKELEMKELR